jgi:hypothetical protein
MKKIVLAAHPDNEYTELLARLIESVFPECEVDIAAAEPGVYRNEDEARSAV